jgi:tight adherence protein C
MVTKIIILILIAAVVGIILVIVTGIKRAKNQEEDPLEQRLAEFSQRGENVSLEEIELSQPFMDRVILPAIHRLGEISSRFTPQHVLEQTRKRLELAGNPGRIDAATLLVLRFVAAGFLGGLIFLVTLMTQTISVAVELLLVLIFVVLGYIVPDMYIKSRIDRRQKQVRKAMPDALDLLTICVEAGLGFDAALSKVNQKWDNELSMALGRVIREIQLGKLRRDALKDMADHLGIPEMTSFVAAVIQSEMLGVSLAKVLRIQSDQMRVKRRQRAEEEAHKAPIKMILPLGIFVFPSLLIVLLTPAGIKLWRSLGFLV